MALKFTRFLVDKTTNTVEEKILKNSFHKSTSINIKKGVKCSPVIIFNVIAPLESSCYPFGTAPGGRGEGRGKSIEEL